MSQYRAYFVPGAVGPSGLCGDCTLGDKFSFDEETLFSAGSLSPSKAKFSVNAAVMLTVAASFNISDHISLPEFMVAVWNPLTGSQVADAAKTVIDFKKK